MWQFFCWGCRVMKMLTILLETAPARILRADSFHDDNLRANQGGEPAGFGPWRALVGR
jgi:hypothetical protein